MMTLRAVQVRKTLMKLIQTQGTETQSDWSTQNDAHAVSVSSCPLLLLPRVGRAKLETLWFTVCGRTRNF